MLHTIPNKYNVRWQSFENTFRAKLPRIVIVVPPRMFEYIRGINSGWNDSTRSPKDSDCNTHVAIAHGHNV